MRRRTVDPAMDLRYRCILIDHDDTAVDSTEAVHYPAHVEALRILRPGRERGFCGAALSGPSALHLARAALHAA